VPRTRLDALLVKRGLAETRERAQALVLDGSVSVDGATATRPAQLVTDDAQVAFAETRPSYVSRGALKLEAALNYWRIDPTDKVALDVGASTGGFTDLLLSRGAARAYAVDVGHGQLHYKLRADTRVVVMERTNVRNLESLPERPDLAVIDVSFISLRLALPPVFALNPTTLIALIKPQFEAGRSAVRKGVVRDPSVHRQVLHDLRDWSLTQAWQLTDVLMSPIRGPAGNIEFLSRWLPEGAAVSAQRIEEVLENAR
jgi:23S rRNA (cytidine1920-2'-O)/16S rRNA (cytidine1409-2'-O)-methyltransferase